jgi:hypothetical protein
MDARLCTDEESKTNLYYLSVTDMHALVHAYGLDADDLPIVLHAATSSDADSLHQDVLDFNTSAAASRNACLIMHYHNHYVLCLSGPYADIARGALGAFEDHTLCGETARRLMPSAFVPKLAAAGDCGSEAVSHPVYVLLMTLRLVNFAFQARCAARGGVALARSGALQAHSFGLC